VSIRGFSPLKVTFKALGAAVGAILLAAAGTQQLTAAFSNTRTISFFHIHTKETVTVTYKKDGKLVPEAMDKIDWIMRDWRKNEKTKMDPHTIDILWEMHSELGSKEPIHIICGYRSRATNEMLRRTTGGQASESQHITGKAIDVTFPDVSLKQIRYSALIREQGGVGYYPTSGIPFVHVDTGRVRHWPRLPRYELALLFPNGSSQHHPSDGGDITMADVRIAQAQHKDLATQIAGFFTLRQQPRDAIMVADAGSLKQLPAAVAAKPAAKPTPAPKPEPFTVAALVPAAPQVAPSPKLVAAPKLIERPSRLTPGPSEADRSQLMELVAFATQADAPRLVHGPKPAVRPGSAPRAEAPPTPLTGPEPRLQATFAETVSKRTMWTQVAALSPELTREGFASGSPVASDAGRPGWSTGWIAAPAFDEEHPEELSYRPFPVAPLLTASASINEPVLSRITAPDVAKILQLIDSPTAVPPMRFLPGDQVAEVMWAQQFQGQPVQLADLAAAAGAEDVPTKLIPRAVKTTTED
jgi:uncharacterized protein YcbK (DUF882 family)